MKWKPKGKKEKDKPPYFYTQKTNGSIAGLNQKTAFSEFV